MGALCGLRRGWRLPGAAPSAPPPAPGRGGRAGKGKAEKSWKVGARPPLCPPSPGTGVRHLLQEAWRGWGHPAPSWPKALTAVDLFYFYFNFFLLFPLIFWCCTSSPGSWRAQFPGLLPALGLGAGRRLSAAFPKSLGSFSRPPSFP